MKVFTYTKFQNGIKTKAEIYSENEEEAIKEIQKTGAEILSINEKDGNTQTATGKTKQLSFFRRLLSRKVKLLDKIYFYQNLGKMLKAGLPLVEGLDLIREDSKEGQFKDMITQFRYDIERGNSLSMSMLKFSDVFTQSDIAMIKAGEVGGSLDQSFLNLYKDLKNEYDLVKKIKAALTYPAIILSVMVLIIIILFIFVLPQLAALFQSLDVEIPFTTKIMFWLSAFMKQYVYFIIPALIGIVIGIRIAFKRSVLVKKIYDKTVIRLPFLNKYFKFFLIVRFTRMLGLLLKSGVPILEALDITEQSMINNEYVKAVVEIKQMVKRGDKLSDSIAKFDKLFPTFVNRMVKVGDRSGAVSDSLIDVSEYYRENLDEMFSSIATVIEPVIMVILGGGVAFIALSVISPIYEITNSVSSAGG